jgi:hypothetical protein
MYGLWANKTPANCLDGTHDLWREVYATLAAGRITAAGAARLVKRLSAQCEPSEGDCRLAIDILANLEGSHVLQAINLADLRKTVPITDSCGLATFDALAKHVGQEIQSLSSELVDSLDYRCLSRLLFVGVSCDIDLIAAAQDTCFWMQRCAFQKAYHGLQCLALLKETSDCLLTSSFLKSSVSYLSHIGKIYPSVLIQWEHVFLKRAIRHRKRLT